MTAFNLGTMKRTFLKHRSLKELKAIAKKLNYQGVDDILDNQTLITMLSGHTDRVILRTHNSLRRIKPE